MQDKKAEKEARDKEFFAKEAEGGKNKAGCGGRGELLRLCVRFYVMRGVVRSDFAS